MATYAAEIRKFAKAHDHKVVGKLTRRIDIEKELDDIGLKDRVYTDAAGNEYYYRNVGNHHICIATADGAVI